MKLEQLFYFREAVKYNSISIASEKNYMSQSSFSQSIINLERELGIELLNRTNAGVTPTHAGEFVLEKAEDIFKSVDEIIEVSKEQRNLGEVSISCIPCICDWIIPKTIQKLNAKEDDIILSVATSESSVVAHNVSTGISKFGILIKYNELERIADLRYTALFVDEYVLYVGKNSPYWESECITYKEFLKEPYIAYQDEFRKYNGGLTNMIGTSSQLNIIFRTDNCDAIKSLIAQNNYVAFFPKYMSENDFYIQNGMIRRIRISDRKLEFEVGYVESIKYKTKKVDKKVLDVIKKTVKNIKL